MLRNNLMLPTEALDIPEAIDFDGTNDYLSRSSDLVGNTDGKTFTFSAWVWESNQVTVSEVFCSGTGYKFFIQLTSGSIAISAKNAAGTVILNASATAKVAASSFTHILVSVNLANVANRSVYINDISQSVTWTTYTNDTIDFTNANHYVGSGPSADFYDGRLAHVFLAYEYIDLSIESNRRIFITADRKPA